MLLFLLKLNDNVNNIIDIIQEKLQKVICLSIFKMRRKNISTGNFSGRTIEKL
jgi:hypothetical protein